MTYFLQDILRQPEELERTLSYLSGPGRRELQTAADAIRKARPVYLTGMGSSGMQPSEPAQFLPALENPCICRTPENC